MVKNTIGILKMKFIFNGGRGGGGVEYNRWKSIEDSIQHPGMSNPR